MDFELHRNDLHRTRFVHGDVPPPGDGQALASESHKIDRTVLPPVDPPFEGMIEVAFKDSEPDFPEPLRAPAGAPNVLLIMGDDIGYGHMGAFGGPARTPVFDRLAADGLVFSNFHTTRVPLCSLGATPIPSAWAASRRPRSDSPATTRSSRAAPPPCSKSFGRTDTAPPGSARPT